MCLVGKIMCLVIFRGCGNIFQVYAYGLSRKMSDHNICIKKCVRRRDIFQRKCVGPQAADYIPQEISSQRMSEVWVFFRFFQRISL